VAALRPASVAMAFKCPKSSDNEALLFSQRQPPQARMNDRTIARPM
jgi:hypothetical protein